MRSSTVHVRIAVLTTASVLFAPVLVPAQDANLRQPTHADLSYGPHPANVLDFWMAEGDGPRPLLVYIHGGGWVGGDKKQPLKRITSFLDRGISYAAINYRLTGEAPLPAPVHDAARAIQFIKSKAAEWNIDRDRIVLTGGSAGACTSMWILLHDDLADPNAADPVLRESTRVRAAAVSGGQTSIDPRVIEPWLGPNVLKHRMINMAVGEATIEGALENYEQHRDLYREFSPYNHLDGDDPPLFMTYGGDMTLPSKNAGHGIHHPVYGAKMKEKADRLGHECHLLIPGVSRSDQYKTADEFMLTMLLSPPESREESESGFIDLYNGRDLTGWGYRDGKTLDRLESFDGEKQASDGRYSANGEILTVNPRREGSPRLRQLWTDRELAGNFVLKLEFRAAVNADSGIFVRKPQLQCRDYLVAGPYNDLKRYRPQDWNEIVVTVRDNVAHCTCNGEVLNAAMELPVIGPIGLEADRGQMEYRRIRIKYLP